MEVSASEALGDMSVRENYDDLGDDIYASNHRLVSTYESGAVTEANTVSFAQLFGRKNEYYGSPCSIVVADSVDEDDLHPYNTNNRVRRDVTAAVVLTEHAAGSKEYHVEDVKSCSQNSQDKGLVDVVVRRVTFIKVHRPEFEIPENDLLDLFDRITRWPDVMMQSVRATITAQL
ncbi:unnamed protein product [Phytophthora fragariaefolia]|uniref:Unnamed protein product n=1 Tax=Phytophthora fragariaefolia TaxID=1490495 RepID=A0A9W6XJW6_9STRA|nr:unnamed protein product [Phytophthora fragariaefolia]